MSKPRIRIKNKTVSVRGTVPMTFSGGAIKCPQASTLGDGKYEAYPGDWVSYDPNDRWGRIVGKVTYGKGERESAICVATLGLEGTLVYLRYVKREEITRVLRNPPRQVFEWITSEGFVDWIRDPELIMQANAYGTLSEGYIDSLESHRKAWEQGCSPAAYPHLLKEAQAKGMHIQDYINQAKKRLEEES